jgi:hypothetical protein
MTIHNKKTDLTCLACLKSGNCIVIDTFFEGDGLVVLIKCDCGGISKYHYKAWSAEYVSGERKAIYSDKIIKKEEG